MMVNAGLFVFELSTEEIPATYQQKAYEQLNKLIPFHLKESKVNYDDFQAFATPRRLGFSLKNVKSRTPRSKEQFSYKKCRLSEFQWGIDIF